MDDLKDTPWAWTVDSLHEIERDAETPGRFSEKTSKKLLKLCGQIRTVLKEELAAAHEVV